MKIINIILILMMSFFLLSCDNTSESGTDEKTDKQPAKENQETDFSIVDTTGYSDIADIMPEPVGGINAIAAKITYPENAKKEGLQGKVFIRAFVDKNGEVTYAEAIKKLSPECDSVALKAVMETRFTPGKKDEKEVKTIVFIPISYKLQ